MLSKAEYLEDSEQLYEISISWLMKKLQWDEYRTKAPDKI